jgi:hypothetical protein
MHGTSAEVGEPDAIAECERRHATRWDAAAHRTCRRPSPLCTVLEKCTRPPPCCGVAYRRRPGGRCAAAAAAQQLKFSSSSTAAAEIQQAAVRSARRKRRLSTNLASQGPRNCCGVACESPDRRSMPACRGGRRVRGRALVERAAATARPSSAAGQISSRRRPRRPLARAKCSQPVVPKGQSHVQQLVDDAQGHP